MITRSEAIKQLRLLKGDINYGLSFISKTKDKNLSLESLSMAIKSLETDEAYQLEYERTTKDDLVVDLIPREKVMQILQEHWLSGTVAHRIIAEIGNDIQRLPSVSQEPRKGHWIVQLSNEEQGERPFIWWKCSKCGQVIFSETEHDRLEFHAFCGRCGADMREVKE